MKTEFKVLPEKGASPEEITQMLGDLKKLDIEDNKARLLQGIHQGESSIVKVPGCIQPVFPSQCLYRRV